MEDERQASARLRDEKRALEQKERDWEVEKRRLQEKVDDLKRQLANLRGTPAVMALSDKTAEAAGVPSSKTYYRRPATTGPDGQRRPSGGQPGHAGQSRVRPTPNRPPVMMTLDFCPVTGKPMGVPADWLERTITDLPDPCVDVYVERRARYHCVCSQRHVAESLFPPYQQWGPNLVSFVAHHRMLAVSVAKIQGLLREHYGLDVSEAAILGMEAFVAKLLGPRYEKIRAQVVAAGYVCADETSFRVAGQNGWLWTFAAIHAVLYEAAPTRGASVPIRVLEGFDGVLVRDAWDPYDQVTCKAHQLDPVHVNRWLERAEIKAGIEPRPLLKPTKAKLLRRGRPPDLIAFADGVRSLYREAVSFVEASRPPSLKRRLRKYASLHRRLRRHLNRAWRNEDAVRIAKELRSRIDQVFTFVRIPDVPWHNNDAELQIRQGVLHRKVSGGRRSREGADIFATLLSVFQTSKKTGENFSALVRRLYAPESQRGLPSGTPQS